MRWRIPTLLLDAVTVNSGTNVYGPTVDMGEVLDTFYIQIEVTFVSGSGTVAVDLEGSLDGVNWYMVVNIPNGTTSSGILFESATGKPSRYLRAYGVDFSGTPTTTVSLLATAS